MLDTEKLTGRQLLLTFRAFNARCPVKVAGGELRSARALEKAGWGTVERVSETETVFRMNDAANDAVESDQAFYASDTF
jgi:hypothetical protein